MKIKWLILPSKVPPNGSAPIAPADVQKLFTGPGGLAEYWSQVRLGHIDFSDSLVFGQWITPSFDRSGYRAGAAGGVDRDRLKEAILETARSANAPLDQHNHIVFYLNEQFDTFGSEGRVVVGHGDAHIVIAHEMGQGIGLAHSYGSLSPPILALNGATIGKHPASAPPNLVPAVVYGDPGDLMSAANVWHNKDGRGPGICGPFLRDLGALGDERISGIPRALRHERAGTARRV